MSRIMLLFALLIVLTLFAVVSGCSSGKNNPASPPETISEVPSSISATNDNHELLGIWTANFDLKSLTATVEENRVLAAHYNVRPYLPAPNISVVSYDTVNQIIEVKVTVRNPYAITAYDLRVIIFTDSVGHLLVNDDNWTGLYDIAGGDTINPFKAYAKTTAYRMFGAYTSYFENLQVKIPGGNAAVYFAIDASFPSNCSEPYSIANFQHGTLYNRSGATAASSVNAYSWTNQPSVVTKLTCNAVMGANVLTFDSDGAGNFTGTITNSQNATYGQYPALLSAQVNEPTSILYDYVTLTVTRKPDGWVVQLPEGVGGVESDSEGFPLVASFPDLNKYNKDGDVTWSNDVAGFGQFSDLHFDSEFDFVYFSGQGGWCATSGIPTSSGNAAAKYNLTPTEEWYDYHCPESYDTASGFAITSDLNKNCYVGGANIYEDPDSYFQYASLWKLNSDGETIWFYEFENPVGNIRFSDLAWSSGVSLVTVGEFWGTSVDFDPSTDTHTFYPSGSQDAFLGFYTTNGTYRQVQTWGASSSGEDDMVYARSVALDSRNNIYVTGDWSGTVDFDPRTSSTSIYSSYGTSDIYVSKFDASGVWIRTIVIPTSGSVDYGKAIASDADGNVYITGSFSGQADFDPGAGEVKKTSVGEQDIFLAKYASDLRYSWVRTWGSVNDNEVGNDVEVDPSNQYVYMTGTFFGTIDFDPGSGIKELTADAGGDSFVMRLRATGLWQ